MLSTWSSKKTNLGDHINGTLSTHICTYLQLPFCKTTKLIAHTGFSLLSQFIANHSLIFRGQGYFITQDT